VRGLPPNYPPPTLVCQFCVERLRHRGDVKQADLLERWLRRVAQSYADSILPFDEETAHVWGRLRVPNPEDPLDKQIAATALIHDLTVVTRNAEPKRLMIDSFDKGWRKRRVTLYDGFRFDAVFRIRRVRKSKPRTSG